MFKKPEYPIYPVILRILGFQTAHLGSENTNHPWRPLWLRQGLTGQLRSIKNRMGPNPNGPRFVSCNRVIRYSALGVLSVVRLKILWISFPNNFSNNPPTLQVARISNPISEPRQVQLLLLQEFLLKKKQDIQPVFNQTQRSVEAP